LFRNIASGNLDKGLTPEQHAACLAFRRMMEEHLYWFGVHIRWIIEENWQTTCRDTFGRMPLPFRLIVPNIVRKKVVQQLAGHGMGRLGRAEIERMALDDFKALSEWLDDKPYFMGDEPREIDATTFAFLLSMLRQAHRNPIKPEIDALTNLAPYVERMRARYFPELSGP
jgi:glutathione S-transferase